MEIRSSIAPLAVFTVAVVGVSLSSPAAASADSAVMACKNAIVEEQGSELRTRLKKIKSRGGAYEAWFNLSDGDTQMTAYCLSKRDSVDVITSEGSWKGRNPKRPEVEQAS
jgi:hypothetical protein